jgi:hypothetical protein
MVDHVSQGGEPPIVVEPALLVSPKALERRGSITFVGRPVGLEVVNPDLRRRVKIPSRLGKERRHVADGAGAREPDLPRRRCIEAPDRRLRRGQGKLVEVQRGRRTLSPYPI